MPTTAVNAQDSYGRNSVISKNNKRRPAVTAATARIKLADGQKRPPDGYCRRCWRKGQVTRSTSGKNRCQEHDLEIKKENAAIRERPTQRRQEEVDQADRLFTALKWLARETGAGYSNSPVELNAIVFGAFWSALPDKRTLSQEEIDLACQTAIAAFEADTGEEAVIAPCPICMNQDRRSRTGNNFECVNCGWTPPEGTFGLYFSISKAGL